MIENATVLYGLGAQKAGTTWVYRQLRRSGQCHMREIKEAHYFDAAYLPGEGYHIARRARILEERAAELRAALAAGDRTDARRLEADIRMRLDHLAIYSAKGDPDAAYRGWLMQGWRGEPLVADITPSYALLGGDILKRMQGMARRALFLFILRDPVDRLWSAIKAFAGSGRAADETQAQTNAEAAAEGFLADDMPAELGRVLNRNDYGATLRAMEAAVPGKNRLVLFYERLFRAGTMAKLAAFLGLERLDADFAERPNRSGGLTLPARLEEALCRRLADQYHEVGRVFGTDRLPGRWRSRMEAFT